MGPLLGLALKGAMSLGSALLGNKLSKSKPSPLEQNVINTNLDTMRTGVDTGKGLLAMGTPAVTAPANYYSSILSGNRGDVTSALAPEINRINAGYDTAARTSAALNPRGGPSASFMAELPFQRQHDVTTLLQGARPEAAARLAPMGSSLISQGANLITGSTAAGRDILSQQQNQKQMEAERGRSIGMGLYDLIQKFGYPGIDQLLKSKGSSPLWGDGPNQVP